MQNIFSCSQPLFAIIVCSAADKRHPHTLLVLFVVLYSPGKSCLVCDWRSFLTFRCRWWGQNPRVVDQVEGSSLTFRCRWWGRNPRAVDQVKGSSLTFRCRWWGRNPRVVDQVEGSSLTFRCRWWGRNPRVIDQVEGILTDKVFFNVQIKGFLVDRFKSHTLTIVRSAWTNIYAYLKN